MITGPPLKFHGTRDILVGQHGGRSPVELEDLISRFPDRDHGVACRQAETLSTRSR